MCYIKDYEKKIVVTEIQKIIEYHNWSDNFVLFYDRINNKYDIFPPPIYPSFLILSHYSLLLFSLTMRKLDWQHFSGQIFRGVIA